MIREGADFALVELLFQAEDEKVRRKLKELDLPAEDDSVCISRRIQPGRSICRINGEPVSTRQVKSLPNC